MRLCISFRKAQGEYVAALVMLSLLVSMVALLAEWQAAIHQSAEQAIEDIEKSKEMLEVFRSSSSIRVVNSWGKPSTIIAIVFKFADSESLSAALAELSKAVRLGKLVIDKHDLIAVLQLPRESWITVDPASATDINASIDPAIPILVNHSRTVCVYTLYSNIFCNSTPASLGLIPNATQPALLFNDTTHILNRLAVINYSKVVPVSFTYPPFSAAIPPSIPVIIVKDLKSLPRFLVETVVKLKVLINFSCHSVVCPWTPRNFTIILGNGAKVKPSYVCLFNPYPVYLIGCSNGDEPVRTSLRFMLAVVDGVPVYIDTLSGPYPYTVSFITFAGISNGTYTIAEAYVTSVAFKGSNVVAVMHTSYSWRLCKFTIWSSWGLCSNSFVYTLAGSGLYGVARYGLFDLPLLVLKKTSPQLYPPKAPTPPLSKVAVTIYQYYPGYAPNIVSHNLRYMSGGYADVVSLSSVMAVFIQPVARLRVLVPTYVVASNGTKIRFRIPLLTLSLTNVYSVAGYVISAVKTNYTVRGVEVVSGKVYRGYEITTGRFNLGLQPPVSSRYVYTLFVVVSSSRLDEFSVVLLHWPATIVPAPSFQLPASHRHTVGAVAPLLKVMPSS